MSRIKTATSALTAAVLVTGIGLAWAQTEENQPTDPMAADDAEAPARRPDEGTSRGPQAPRAEPACA